ncbi:MAG TPA: PKD domain-containing protein [Solirubrobacteraceae bacterium]|jgi:hypothetical protein
MDAVRSTGRVLWAVVCVCATLALAATSAQGAPEPHPHVGKLPGYPVMRGVVPVLGSKAAVDAHERLVKSAFVARARHASGLTGVTEPNEQFISACREEAVFASTQDVCYRGGPVLRNPTIHLIFWQGEVEEDISKEPHVKLFPLGYVETVKRYFEDLVHDNGAQTNVFAIDPQYFDENVKGELVPGEYALSFQKEVDITVDTTKFPEHATGGCTDETVSSEGPCLLDSDIQKEAEKVAGTSTKGLRDIYVVFTPPGVGGCFGEGSGECAYRQYCAYHGDFGGDGHTPGDQTLYVDLPYLGEVAGCDLFVHPNEVVSLLEEKNHEDHGADAVIDTASHEVNETITDPIGSQCESGAKGASECEPNSWTDVIGQEVADKCLPPESTVFGTYGEPLGELLPGRGASLYNQNIASDHYWTQREWSNEAGLFEGGCVQRVINASFTISAGGRATVPITLDGSPSGAPGDPAVYWVWNFGGGEQVGTASPTISHAFAEAGEQVVALTAYDAYGNSEATVESFSIGAAPIPPPPPAPLTITVKQPILPVHLTAGQMGTRLGLRATKLSGKGPFSLGHAECPPACGVTIQLYAKVPVAPGSHQTTKLELIGSAHFKLAAKGTRKLVLSLNAKGRALERVHRSLRCRLVVTVEGQEGGTWQIVRLPTLTR